MYEYLFKNMKNTSKNKEWTEEKLVKNLLTIYHSLGVIIPKRWVLSRKIEITRKKNGFLIIKFLKE